MVSRRSVSYVVLAHFVGGKAEALRAINFSVFYLLELPGCEGSRGAPAGVSEQVRSQHE